MSTARPALRRALGALVVLVAAPFIGAQTPTSPAPGAPLARPAAASPADSAVPITIDEAVHLAQQNAPQAVQARGTERTNRAAVRSAYGELLPSLSVSLGAVRQLPAGATTRLNPQTGVRETLPIPATGIAAE